MSEKTQNCGDGRNAAGQFVKGTSGNPKGRPKKIHYSEANTTVLANTVVNVKVDGQVRALTRREVNHLRLFEAANRGDVRAQIYLDRKFEKQDQVLAEIAGRLQRYEAQHLYGEEAWGMDHMPPEVRIWMEQAYHVLHREPLWNYVVPEDHPALREFMKKVKDESGPPETPGEEEGEF